MGRGTPSKVTTLEIFHPHKIIGSDIPSGSRLVLYMRFHATRWISETKSDKLGSAVQLWEGAPPPKSQPSKFFVLIKSTEATYLAGLDSFSTCDSKQRGGFPKQKVINWVQRCSYGKGHPL